MTSVSKPCQAKFEGCVSVHSICIFLQVALAKQGYLAQLTSGFLLPWHSSCGFSHNSSPSCFLHLSWHQHSGRKAKWSVSEEGHPLGMVFGTNTAAAFPLLCPSVGFGPLLWTTTQIWPGFSRHACTAARPLYTGLFCKYGRQQLNMGMELEFWALGSGMVKTLGKGRTL